MDEYNSGMDPEVKVYFRKIMRSFSAGLAWLMVFSTSGLFFKLGYLNRGWHWYNAVFYGLLVVSLILLVRYFIHIWGKKA